VARRFGKRRALDRTRLSHGFLNPAERVKARIRAKIEPLFRVVKPQ